MAELKILKSEYNIGLKKPISFLHITDTHIMRDSQKDNGRAAMFKTTDEQIEDYFLQALAYAKENNLPIIHTGDLIDYITNENLEFLDEHFSKMDYLFAPGSHEYVHLVPGSEEYKAWREAGFCEDDEYRAKQIKVVAPHFKNNLYFDSKMIGEVNFVILDNSYANITVGQLEALKAEVAKGHPVVLGMHNPIDNEDMYKLEWTNPNERLCAPKEKQLEYAIKRNLANPESRVRYFDDATYKAVEYIKNEPLIKLVLCGHLHGSFESRLSDGTVQVMTHSTIAGVVREITLI